MDSYDNDWLFLDDDLFCIFIDEYLFDFDDPDELIRDCKMQRLEDED